MSATDDPSAATSEVTPTYDDGKTVVLTLAADKVVVGQARRFVASRWGWLVNDTLVDVELIVAELVANAVKHGKPEIELRLRVDPFALDVAVLDQGDGDVPTSAELSDSEVEAGHGLAIVDRLASRWGVETFKGVGTGKAVWASISRT